MKAEMDTIMTKSEWDEGDGLYKKVVEAFPRRTKEEIRSWFAVGCNMSSYAIHAIDVAWYINKRKRMQNTAPRFLDLGCGIGRIVALAAHMGCESYGIDFEKIYLEYARKAIMKAGENGLAMAIKPKVAYGNFYPPGFEVDYWDEGGGFKKLNDRCFNASRSIDAYANSGIMPKDIDLFYHYQVQEFSRVARFFSECAKNGSWLVFAPSNQRIEETKLPDNLHLKISTARGLTYLFEKRE